MKIKILKDRVALGSYHYWKYPLEYFLDTAVRLEVSNIELWAAAPHLPLDLAGKEDIWRMKGQVRERNLQVCCITPEQCTYPVNLAAEEEALRQYSIRYFKKAIDAAYELECPKVLVTAGYGYYNKSFADAWDRSEDSLWQLAKYAADRQILLVLETLTPLSSNILNTPKQQRAMIRRMPEGSMCAMLDVGQMAYMKQQLSEYLEHGALLGHVHLQDSGSAIHMALGDGELQLGDYITELEEAGYKGMYSFEFNDSRYRMKPEMADEQSIRWLRDQGILQE